VAPRSHPQADKLDTGSDLSAEAEVAEKGGRDRMWQCPKTIT